MGNGGLHRVGRQRNTWVVAGLRSHRTHGCSIGDRDAENKEILKKRRGEKEREKEEEGEREAGSGAECEVLKAGFQSSGMTTKL